jgi:hypothetical protein
LFDVKELLLLVLSLKKDKVILKRSLYELTSFDIYIILYYIYISVQQHKRRAVGGVQQKYGGVEESNGASQSGGAGCTVYFCPRLDDDEISLLGGVFRYKNKKKLLLILSWQLICILVDFRQKMN